MPNPSRSLLLCPRCRRTTTHALLPANSDVCPSCGAQLVASPASARRGALRRRRVADHLVVREYLAGLQDGGEPRVPGGGSA